MNHSNTLSRLMRRLGLVSALGLGMVATGQAQTAAAPAAASAPLELKVSIRDLLNQALKWEQNGALIQSNIRGMSMSLGLGYRL